MLPIKTGCCILYHIKNMLDISFLVSPIQILSKKSHFVNSKDALATFQLNYRKNVHTIHKKYALEKRLVVNSIK